MVYKQKLIILSAVSGALALIYAAALIFSPDRVSARNSFYVWLDPKWVDRVDEIKIQGDAVDSADNSGITLIRRNNAWFAEYADREFPAKEARIEDLLGLLSTKALWPLQGSSTASHERFGLTEFGGDRIILRGGPVGPPLLDLLIGDTDTTGRNVYLRKRGQNEVRSGDGGIVSYLGFSRTSWYNLHLFQDYQDLRTNMVQRVTVIAPTAGRPLVFTRNGEGWIVEGIPQDTLDVSKVEPWIRAILDAEADDFVLTEVSLTDANLTDGRIVLELGDGSSRSIRLGPELPRLQEPKAENALPLRSAAVSSKQVPGSQYGYALSSWTVTRLFRDAAYFKN
ncbi:hypothetical protein AGMMS49991_02550 [Spirochaetia bacterium]|nr:hypothetical protein AGMMS49991_02550 [Spirochaetia bacterium]